MRLVPLSVVLSLSAEQSPSPADGALGVAEVIQVLPGEERLVVRAGRSHRCAECGYGGDAVEGASPLPDVRTHEPGGRAGGNVSAPCRACAGGG